MLHNRLLTLIRLYPLEKGRNRILNALKAKALFKFFVPEFSSPAQLITGQSLKVLGSEYMSDYIRLWGRFERKTENFIVGRLRDGHVFMDVGANFGYFSVVACHKAKECRVLAIEPNPAIAQALRASTRLNNIDSRVEVLEMALSDESGQLPLMCNDHNLGLSHLKSNTSTTDSGSPSAHTVTVSVEVWDDWVRRKGTTDKTSVLKMDIEGAELKALTGMIKFLQRERPSIVVEANNANLNQFGHSRDELEDFLLRLGYKHSLPADNNFYMDFVE